MDIKFRDRLSYRQAKRTVVVALLLGIILSMFQIFYEFIVEKQTMDSTVAQVVGMLKESATMAAYNLDAEQAQNVLRGLFEYKAIRKATIVNEYNEVLGAKERPPTQGPLRAMVNLFFGTESQLGYPLIYDRNLRVGSLSVTIDHYFAAQRWISKAGVVIFTGILRNFILAIILTLIFYYALTLPLLQVIRSIAGVDPRKPAGIQLEVPQAHQKNEMGLLIGTLNRLLHGFATSLEERKAAEARLAQSERKYRNIFENSNDGIFQTTREGRLTTANSMLAKILRFESPRDLMETVTDIRKIYVEPKDRDRLLARIEDEGIVRDFHTEIYRKDGTIVPVAVTIHAVNDAEGNLLFLEGNLEDVSEKQRTEKLRIEKEAAEAANSAKSEFLANMSHEIRTPMNGIIGNTALVLETELTREQFEYLQAIHTSADHLMGVINDVLDFSKIEAGHMDLEQTEFTLRKTIENAVDALAVKAHEKGLELVSHIDADVPDHLLGDPGRLRQIIVNLLGNAVKFTDAGEVVVFCEIKKQQDAGTWLHFSVSDTGIGIAADKLKTIFESFKQADGSTTRKYGGTGLGLTISRQLVELMGGRIWVQSPRDGSKGDDTRVAAPPGTTFHFTARFDRQPNPDASPTDVQTVQIQDKRVLIVDDNATNLKILSGMLSNWGVAYRQACEGKSALAELERAAAEGRPYDLVLTDGQMPVMDGFELSARIKKAVLLPDTIVVMLTSMGLRSDVERCRQMGLSGYLVKPIKQNDLFDAIMLALANSPGGKAPQSQERVVTENTVREERQRRRLNILLAEDNPINQKMAVHMLNKLGHTVLVAENGQSAIEQLQENAIDMVLMDVQMPVMDGLTATRRIRCSQAGAQNIPIIAMTAHALKGDREKCLDAGMNDYISKPFNPQKLTELIARWDLKQRSADMK